MIPILWRYLIKNYLSLLLLSCGAFIAILLTTRMEEIAHFASFGADLSLIIFFTFLQIPYILPIAIPVSCLIASTLLMQRLSTDHELTAIRSSGFSLRNIILPICLCSLILSLANFYIVSEAATFSHLKTNLLKLELRSVNPLILLHNKHLLRIKGIFYDVLGSSKLGQNASDVIIAFPNPGKESLNLLLAKELSANEAMFNAKGLTLITPLKTARESIYSDLIIDSFKESSSALEDFSYFIQKKVASISLDHMNMKQLLLRIAEMKANLKTLPPNDLNNEAIKAVRKSIKASYSEIARRFSAGLAPFSFTLLGLSFGMSIGRVAKKTRLLFPILFAALFLFAFFAAKSFESSLILATSLYLIPHLLMIAASLWKINRINHGID